jgi:hypothetical protein
MKDKHKSGRRPLSHLCPGKHHAQVMAPQTDCTWCNSSVQAEAPKRPDARVTLGEVAYALDHADALNTSPTAMQLLLKEQASQLLGALAVASEPATKKKRSSYWHSRKRIADDFYKLAGELAAAVKLLQHVGAPERQKLEALTSQLYILNMRLTLSADARRWAEEAPPQKG